MQVQNALRYYRKFSAAHSYIVGFNHGHMIYYIETDKIMPRWLYMKPASKGHDEKLQMNLKAKHKQELIKKGAKVLCSETEFLKENEKIRNKGFTFEKLIHDMHNTNWERDNIPFHMQGDININGIETQIKFENAQIVTVKTLHKLQKAK